MMKKLQKLLVQVVVGILITILVRQLCLDLSHIKVGKRQNKSANRYPMADESQYNVSVSQT